MMSMASSASKGGSTPNAAFVTILHAGARIRVPCGTTLGELRGQIEQVLELGSGTRTLIVRGKKILPSTPDETPLSDLKIKHRETILISASSGQPPVRGKGATSGLLADVRKIETTVAKFEKILEEIDSKISKLGQGFLDQEKTATGVERTRLECKKVEEELMRTVLSADALTSGDPSSIDARQDACWRAERKGVVRKAQAALRVCDTLQTRLDEYIKDEFGELAHRRGKPS